MPHSRRWTDRGSLEDRGGQCHAPGLEGAMERSGYSAEEIASATGYSSAVIQDLLEGKMAHRLVISRIASVLNVDPAEIRGEIEYEGGNE